MRFTRFEMQNFRNCAEGVLEIGDARLVVIRGLNHAGKSTVGQGISLMCTPSTSGLDAVGRGFQTKVRRGQAKSVLTAEIQGTRHKVKRTVTLNLNTIGREDKTVCLDDPDWHPLPFENMLAANRPHLSVALNTDHFMNGLDEARQKTLLSSLVLPSKYAFPADKVKAVERFVGEGTVDFKGDPLAAIDKAYRKLFEERTALNRSIREFGIPDAVKPPAGTVDSAKLQADLKRVREERHGLASQKDAALAEANAAALERTKLEGRIATLETRLRDDDERRKAVEARIFDEARIKELTHVTEQQARLEVVVADRQKNQTLIALMAEQIDKLSSLESLGSACPTCDQPIDTERMAAILADLRANMASLKRKDVDFVRDMSGIGDVSGARAALAAHEEALKDKKALNSRMAETNKQLATARKNFDHLPLPPENPTAALAERIKAADAEIEKLEGTLRPVMFAEDRAAEIARKQTELEALKAKAAELDTLVKYFDKDGVKAALLAEHIGAFTDTLNRVLGAWGYKTSFSIEPYEFAVENGHHDTSPLKELSDSERLMFSIAMQSAVAHQSGMGVIVCDRMDTFLFEERQKANACLYEMLRSKALDQVFLILSDDSTDVPNIPESVFFTVEDGRITKQLGRDSARPVQSSAGEDVAEEIWSDTLAG